MSLACSSCGAEPGPASDPASSWGSSLIHASSASERADCKARESCNRRGTSNPSGTGVAVGSAVGGLAGVALGAAVGLSVGVSVETGVSLSAGTSVGVDTVGRAKDSGVGVGLEQAVSVARTTRKNMVAVRNSLLHCELPFLLFERFELRVPFYLPPRVVCDVVRFRLCGQRVCCLWCLP